MFEKQTNQWWMTIKGNEQLSNQHWFQKSEYEVGSACLILCHVGIPFELDLPPPQQTQETCFAINEVDVKKSDAYGRAK
jgi:hypothetical protein